MVCRLLLLILQLVASEGVRQHRLNTATLLVLGVTFARDPHAGALRDAQGLGSRASRLRHRAAKAKCFPIWIPAVVRFAK